MCFLIPSSAFSCLRASCSCPLIPSIYLLRVRQCSPKIDQVRGASTIARAKTGRNDLGARQRKRSARPQTLHTLVPLMRPHLFHLGMREQIVNVPKAFLVWTQMPREARRQSIQRAADVDVIAARKLERAQFANADCLCTQVILSCK